MMNKTTIEVTAAIVTEKENKELENEKKYNQAARYLMDDIWLIRDKLDKACLMLQELTDEYFRKFDRDEMEDHLGIVWEFSRNATFADIIDDYVFQARNIIREMEKRGEKKHD